MTCDDFERRLARDLAAIATDDTVAHLRGCEACAQRVTAVLLAPADLPRPPSGFAHLVAVHAQLDAPSTPPPRRGLRAALLLLAAYVVLGLGWSVGVLDAIPRDVTPAALVAAALLAEVLALAAGVVLWSQAPPMRRRA